MTVQSHPTWFEGEWEFLRPPIGVDLWSLPVRTAVDGADLALLDPDEIHRANRRVDPLDRARFVSVHASMRRTLAKYVGIHPQDLKILQGRDGKPRIAPHQGGEIHWNLSHSGESAWIAVARAPVGIDIEVTREFTSLGPLARRCLTDPEWEQWQRLDPARKTTSFLQAWTRKEAILKCVGSGMAISPNSVDAGLGPEDRWLELVWEGRAHHVRVVTVRPGLGLVMSVATDDCLNPGTAAALRWANPDLSWAAGTSTCTGPAMGSLP